MTYQKPNQRFPRTFSKNSKYLPAISRKTDEGGEDEKICFIQTEHFLWFYHKG